MNDAHNTHAKIKIKNKKTNLKDVLGEGGAGVVWGGGSGLSLGELNVHGGGVNAGVVSSASMMTTVENANNSAAIDGQHLLVSTLFSRRSRRTVLLERYMIPARMI